MQKQKGFTLIELIIVIVILGILAVTVAPKFLDVQRDARISALEGAEGAIKSAIQLVYARASLDGKQGNQAGVGVCDESATATPLGDAENCQVTISGAEVDVDFGYPVLAETADLKKFVDTSDLELHAGKDGTNADPSYQVITIDGTAVVTSSSAAAGADVCQIVYVKATSKTVPATVTAYTGGC